MIFNKHGIIAANFKHTQREKSMKKSVLFTAIF